MKLNFKIIKNLNIGVITTLAFLVVVIFELYFVYVLIYKNLNPTPVVNVTNRIVQVNLKSYNNTIRYLNTLEIFEPPATIFKNSNPFKYNR